ncbi:MAG: nucleoside-diphosphate kinase [Thaumarchaeota archaeon]|nr:nucleoside-diphosphate kinase [Nitrososphaerota archaeon]
MTERTLIIVKPDGVRRSLVGRVLSRFEDKGFKLVELKMLTMDKALAEDFYSPHAQKPFFKELVSFITSGPVVAAVLEGDGAVEVVRRMIGSTKSAEAAPGTVRGDFALGVTQNMIHASDSVESFQRESRIILG